MSCPQVIEVFADLSPELVEVMAAVQPEVVEVVTPGPPGQPGESAAFYVFTTTSPTPTWTINHNLGFKPSVELYNTGSQEIDGDVVHISNNQTVVSFTVAIAGFARLN